MTTYDEWTDRLESTTVAVDRHDVDVAYYDEGDGDPIVLLHGIPTSSYLWRGVAPDLTDDRRVIAPDMAGYGQSSMRDAFDRSIRAQEEMLDSLLADLGLETVDFVGHDLGGGVGLRYASHNPEAIGKLVLSNAVAYDSWPIETIVKLGLPDVIEEMSVQDLQEQLDELFRSTLRDPDDTFVEGMKAPWNSEEGLVSLSRNAIGTNTSHTTELDYDAIDAETLLLWGADDEFQPIEYAERLADDLADATVVGLDEANHWVPEDRSAAYVEELRSFL